MLGHLVTRLLNIRSQYLNFYALEVIMGRPTLVELPAPSTAIKACQWINVGLFTPFMKKWFNVRDSSQIWWPSFCLPSQILTNKIAHLINSSASWSCLWHHRLDLGISMTSIHHTRLASDISVISFHISANQNPDKCPLSDFLIINYLLSTRESYGPTAQYPQDCSIFFIQLNNVFLVP